MSAAVGDADPFGTTTDADAYVPRPACERALDQLIGELRAGRQLLALTGPTGIGKTQLLRVLAVRVEEEAEVLVLPYAGLGFDDLCRWSLGLLGEPIERGAEGEPADALLAAARRRATDGRMLVLALDDASGLPPASARLLTRLVAEAEGALRLVVVPVDDPRAGRVLAALGRNVCEVRLNAPMTEQETAAYVESRLTRRPPPADVASRFDEGAVGWLHRASGGFPRELHQLAFRIQRGIGDPAGDPFERREQWLEVEGDEEEPREIAARDEPVETRQVEAADPAAQGQAPIPVEPGEFPDAEIAPKPEPEEAGGAEEAVERTIVEISAAPVEPASPRIIDLESRGVIPPEAAPSQEGHSVPASPQASRISEPSAPRRRSFAAAAALGVAAVVLLIAGVWVSSRGSEDAQPELRRELSQPPQTEREAVIERRLAPSIAQSIEVSDPETARDETPAHDPAPEGLVEEPVAPVVQLTEEGSRADESGGADPEGAADLPASLDRTAPAQVALIPINLNARPWATVWIDGVERGTTPLAGVPLEEGVHHFRLVFPDGHSREAERRVDAQSRHFSFGL